MSNKANKPLEELFKSALKEHQMPYDPSAWEALSSKLDTQLPVKGKSKLPWFIGAASIISAVTIGLLINTDSAEKSIKHPTASNESTIENQTSTPISNEVKEETPIDNKNSNNTIETIPQHINSEKSPVNAVQIDQLIENYTIDKQTIETKETVAEVQKLTSEAMKPTIVKDWVPFNVPTLCLGDSYKMNNQNATDVIIRDAYFNEVVVPAKSTIDYTVLHEGKHELINVMSGASTESFSVKNTPQLSIQLENELIYEKGLPTTVLSANSSNSTINWSINGKALQNETNQLKIHLYNKGSYSLKAQTTNEFGCSSEAIRSIFIDEDYNLLAVNAFDPQSTDNRKNSFMPFALTVREVDFELIIIDPKDGAVIFESSDATLPWRGQDKRTGQLVESAKTFIWRVILSNPQPGEKAEYKGTIVRM